MLHRCGRWRGSIRSNRSDQREYSFRPPFFMLSLSLHVYVRLTLVVAASVAVWSVSSSSAAARRRPLASRTRRGNTADIAAAVEEKHDTNTLSLYGCDTAVCAGKRGCLSDGSGNSDRYHCSLLLFSPSLFLTPLSHTSRLRRLHSLVCSSYAFSST